MVFAEITELNEFYSIIMNKDNNNKLIIAYFTATWCGPCKKISPIVQNIGDNNDNIIVLKVDVDEGEELSVQYNIDCMPTFKFFRKCNIEECLSFSGADESVLINNIKNILNENNNSVEIINK
jgi:thioredoxin 1